MRDDANNPMTRFAISILITVLMVGCRGKNPQSDSNAVDLKKPDSDSPVQNPTKFREPELTPLVSTLTEGHENLRYFIQKDIPDELFEELFAGIHESFKKRLGADPQPGRLDGTRIDQRGVGMLSVFRNGEPPASVSITSHHRYRPEVTIHKLTEWDRIQWNGTEYARNCSRTLYVFGIDKGISEITINFAICATPTPRLELARKGEEAPEYLLAGHFVVSPNIPDAGASGGQVALFHYGPNERAKLLSREVFHRADLKFSGKATVKLLEIMDMIMIHGINRPGNPLYRDLLKSAPPELWKSD